MTHARFPCAQIAPARQVPHNPEILANHTMRNTKPNYGSCKIAKDSGKLIFYIHGKSDCVIDYQLSINAYKYNPNTEIRILENCGHGCFYQNVDTIIDTIIHAVHKLNNYIPKDKYRNGSNYTCPYYKNKEYISTCPYNASVFSGCDE